MQVPQHNVGNFSKVALKGVAGSMGLDQTAFGSCLDGDRYAAWIQQESNGAVQRGVASTPWLFLNGRALQPMPGSFDALQGAIRQATPR